MNISDLVNDRRAELEKATAALNRGDKTAAAMHTYAVKILEGLIEKERQTVHTAAVMTSKRYISNEQGTRFVGKIMRRVDEQAAREVTA